MGVRMLREEDTAAWMQMRRRLWPDSDDQDAHRWLERHQSKADALTLLAETDAGELAGFAEAGERAYADGCDSSPIAFLEGWYVEQAHRQQGWGAKLIAGVVDWARSRSLTELASDSLLDDHAAIAAHLANGFEEVERSVKFRMNLQGLE